MTLPGLSLTELRRNSQEENDIRNTRTFLQVKVNHPFTSNVTFGCNIQPPFTGFLHPVSPPIAPVGSLFAAASPFSPSKGTRMRLLGGITEGLASENKALLSDCSIRGMEIEVQGFLTIRGSIDHIEQREVWSYNGADHSWGTASRIHHSRKLGTTSSKRT